MKEQTYVVILPELPIVGTIKLTSLDGKSLASIEVVKKQKDSELTPFFKACYTELLHFLSGKKKDINLPVDLSALSPFQTKVLKAMKKIPYGKVASYKDLAQVINSKGYQAIGTACGENPFLLIYPCHRVVGATSLGGFAHGLEMKKALLKLEGLTL
jgi:O-6-methylguanine DNA methyltransferase